MHPRSPRPVTLALQQALRWGGLPWALLALAAIRLASMSAAQMPELPVQAEFCADVSDFNASGGEALFHGVPSMAASWSMPAYSLSNSLLCHHAPGPSAQAAASSLARGLALAATASLVFSLAARTAGSFVTAALAVLLFAWTAPESWLRSDRWLYALYVTSAATALARRGVDPSFSSTLVLASALGASLLVLSPLAFFPALLAVALWVGRRAGRARTAPRPANASPDGGRGARPPASTADLLCLLLLPAGLLLPWAWMNWSVHGRVVFLERDRAFVTMIMAAMGDAWVPYGDWAGLAGPFAEAHPWAWAFGELIRHPNRVFSHFGAFLRDAGPAGAALFGLAAFGVWRLRERAPVRHLGLLAGYLLAAHCLLLFNPDFFLPCWPLAAALAALVVTPRLERRACDGADAPSSRAPSGNALALAGDAAAGRLGERLFLCLWAASLAFALYSLGLAAAYPRRSAAPEPFLRELARRPEEPWLLTQQGLRLLRQGLPSQAADMLRRAARRDPSPRSRDALVLARLVESGGASPWVDLLQPEPESLGSLRWHVRRSFGRMVQGRARQAHDEWRAALRTPAAQDGSLVEVVVRGELEYWPPPRRGAILAGLDAASRPDGPPCRTPSGHAWALGARPMIFARLWLDLVRAAQGPAGLAPGQAAAALKAFRRSLLLRPDDFVLNAAAARAAWFQGNKPAARAHLLRARGLAQAPAALEEVALILQEQGDYAGALAILETLASLEPGRAKWLNHLGVVKSLLGRRSEATRDFDAAILADPAYLPPYLSLISLHAREGGCARAEELRVRALRRAGPGADPGLVRLLRDRPAGCR
ncbi:MAG: tetratricopeptide repeat protein [Elusimicrobia bacterium]|nr:tetratricopeptide repeat protein [Elusimicrobiota bacterium]